MITEYSIQVYCVAIDVLLISTKKWKDLKESALYGVKTGYEK